VHVNVDRDRANQSGLTQRDVANSLLISLNGNADDQGAPPASQEQQDHEPGERRGYGAFPEHVFANDKRAEGKNAVEAALSAGFTGIRPVIMTALAMIIGMMPMALSLGEGGEQNAPLGRAVIGGLLIATVTTLFFVPIMYSLMRKRPPEDQDRIIEEEAHEGLPPAEPQTET
jgi:multidrug efflux pump subunit AcrB